MKAHKYWSLGALAAMIGTFYTGYKNMKTAHKYFACSSLAAIHQIFMNRFKSFFSILHTHLDSSSAISKNLHTFLLYRFLLSSLILLLPFLDRSSM